MKSGLLSTTIASAALIAGLSLSQAQIKGGETAPGAATRGTAAGVGEPTHTGRSASPPAAGGQTMGNEPGTMGRSETTPRAEEKAMPRKQGDKQTMGVGQGREGNAEQARERAERKDRTGINGAPNARDEANGRRGEIESTGRSVARGNITPEMRTRVRSEIPNIQVRSAPDLNVDVRVGGVLPRTVTEYWEPIPADIVTIVPEWRAYRIVKVGGEILVIDPDTFEIVDVLSG